MIFTNEIPHLTLYKMRTALPRDMSDQYKGCMVILNNPTISDNINFIKHPKMLSYNKYLRYYMDYRYVEKIGVKRINRNNLKGRQEIYAQVSSSAGGLVTPNRFEQLKGRNFYYDLLVYTDLYLKNQRKQLVIKERIIYYFDYLLSKINQPRFSPYKKRILVMDLDAWEKHADYINSPVMYLFLSFRKWFDEFKKLGDIDIILYNKEFMVRINPKLCNPKDFPQFKLALSKVYKASSIEDDYLDALIAQEELANNVQNELSGIFNFTGDFSEDIMKDIDSMTKDIAKSAVTTKDIKVIQTTKTDRTVDNDLKDQVEDNSINKIDVSSDSEDEIEDIDAFDLTDSDIISDINDDKPTVDETTKEIVDELQEDKELLRNVSKVIKNKTTGKTTASIKRDEAIRKKQQAIKLKNVSMKDLEDMAKRNKPVPVTDLSSKISTINKNVKKQRYINFEKTYNTELAARDTLNILKDLNNKSIPAYVIDLKVEDTSDELNYRETYKITLEDENRVRHNITVDMPKFIDDKFIWLNGSKKTINKQLTMKPIVKTGPDAVQVVSNYNKIFVYRVGQKLTKEMEAFKKTLSSNIPNVKIEIGDNSVANRNYITTLEYDEIGVSYKVIENSKTKAKFIFSQELCIAETGFDENKHPGKFPIGIVRGEVVLCDIKTGFVENTPLVEYISAALGEEFDTVYMESSTFSKRLAYSEASVMAKRIPLILMLSYMEGLTKVLEKANIKYSFSDKREYDPKIHNAIRFADGYLYYEKYPIENQLLMNGLLTTQTGVFDFLDMDDPETYTDIFFIKYGTTGLPNALMTFYEFMIDPITKEVLEDLDYPTDFVSVMCVANNLLADNSYITENNMNLYRIRSNEIVNGILHAKLAEAYSKYRSTAMYKRPTKISIPRDAIMKELSALPTVETHSTLNPIYESEKVRAVSAKGYKGMNLDQAYTEDKRYYDPTMIGLVGMSTSPDYNVGVIRQLTMEPNIVTARGYIDIKDDSLNEVKDVNIFTPAELLSPLGASRDDSTRTAMSSKQSKHILPITKSSPVLISNGAEKVVQYGLSRDFSVIAKDDGEVVEVNESVGLLIVKYKNGESEAIDLKQRTVKNAQSGMYLPNKLVTNLKLGDKVKKNDIIATESKFFSNGIEGNRLNIGSFQKVAVTSCYATLEDSGIITKKMSEDMSSDIILSNEAILGSNADITQIVKVGDHVSVGDPLITFTQSYEDASYNKLLSGLSDDIKDDIQSLSRVPIKAKSSGVITDIKIYCTVDPEELSDSAKKVVTEYWAKLKKRRDILNKYDKSNNIVKCGMLLDEPIGKISPDAAGSIKGRKVFDGILIEFYIQHRDSLGIGDKFIFFTALKSICGEVIPEGLEPFTLDKPSEEVSTLIGPSAILARKTPSVLLTIYTNKILVELKNKLEDIYFDRTK